MLKPRKSILGLTLASALAIAALSGCGGHSSSSTPPPLAVAITVQPASQTIPIGSTGTFTVTATGTTPLNYQWTKDGVEIAGATSSSYTTPVIAQADSGSKFEAVVTNAVNSATSNAATLTAGPRSPKSGDLRYLLFEQISAPGLGNDGGEATNILASSSFTINSAVGTPLVIGPDDCDPAVEYDCSWRLQADTLPPPDTGLSMSYQGGDYSSFASDLKQIVQPNRVIMSLDFEPVNGAYALAYVQTAQTTSFSYQLEVVPPSQIAATVAQDGAKSRIVTAASFDANGQANLISYGWQGDTTTVYETQTTVVSGANVTSAATTLAAQGYIISAFGGNDTDGYMLIGIRVQGDTLPRPVTLYSPAGSTQATNPTSAYFTTVAYLEETDGYFIVNEQ